MHLKQYLEIGLVHTGIAALSRQRVRGDTLVLAYHNIVPNGESPAGDISLHLPLRSFVSQLDEIARTHDVVPLESLLTSRGARDGRPRVAITFDDAYQGALLAGVPELRRRGMPATVFVAPGLLGASTWWDVLADPKSGAVPPAIRDRALLEFLGNGERILSADSFHERRSTVPRIASEAELLAASRVVGISIASHTWTHSNLAALTAEAIARELRTSKDWLSARCASFVPWLSYPYGLWNVQAERTAADLGYVGAFRVEGGWMRANTTDRRHALPRFNVPAGISLNGFRLRLAGIAAGT